VLRPSLLAPHLPERRDPRPPHRRIRRRPRLLTRPAIVASLVSLVWRRVRSIAEVQKVLSLEELLGVTPRRINPQAITTRLDVRSAVVLNKLVAEVCTRVQVKSPPPRPHPRWVPVWERFPLLAMVDGSTREALRNKTKVLPRREGLVLGGKVMVMVKAFSHHPLGQRYTEDTAATDQRFAGEIPGGLPAGGLQVAQSLGAPLERLSGEMVFRAFSHHSRAAQHGERDDPVALLVAHAKLLGIVKQWCTPHRECQPLESIMKGDP
jgi:hypothetical protein